MSTLYHGIVTHSRVAPKQHNLKYRIFSLLLDLATLDEETAQMRLFSHNRFNLFSFHDRDYGDGSGNPLAWAQAQMKIAGLDTAGSRITLLTMPRLLGYAFNPISVYFCHAAGGALAAILYEVNNTFGQSHAYVVPAAGEAEERQTADKRLYVSPFYRVEGGYQFKLIPPTDRFRLVIAKQTDGDVDFTANLIAERRTLTDVALLRLFFGMPLMTLGVVAAIHWEAVRLWIKGAPFGARPPGPKFGFSGGRAISRFSWNDAEAMSGRGSDHEQCGRVNDPRRPGARVA